MAIHKPQDESGHSTGGNEPGIHKDKESSAHGSVHKPKK